MKTTTDNKTQITINWHRRYHQNHNTPIWKQHFTIRYNGMSIKVGNAEIDRHMPVKMSRLIPEYGDALRKGDTDALSAMWRPFVVMAVLMGYMK